MSKEGVPYAVRRFMERLYEVTKVEAIVVHEGDRWTVEHRNERVLLTRTYHWGPQGTNINQIENTLSVDGKRHPLVPGFAAYAKLFLGREVETTLDDDYYKEPLEEIPPGDFIPAIVQGSYAAIRTGLLRKGNSTIEVRVGRLDHLYVIEVVSPKATVRWWFHQAKKGRFASDKKNPVSIFNADGKNITDEVGTDLDKILAALLGSGSSPDATPTIGRPRQAPGTANSVSVRKTTVIRN